MREVRVVRVVRGAGERSLVRGGSDAVIGAAKIGGLGLGLGLGLDGDRRGWVKASSVNLEGRALKP